MKFKIGQQYRMKPEAFQKRNEASIVKTHKVVEPVVEVYLIHPDGKPQVRYIADPKVVFVLSEDEIDIQLI